ncbi:MAG: hypothetical protein PHN79_08345 [Methanoregula sp.]|nr:hypothetical protein [Methanoregula sp.]
MIAEPTFHSTKNRCTKLLISRGYAPVQPVTASFLSRSVPLHLIGMRGDYEALCVKIKLATSTTSGRTGINDKTGATGEKYVEAQCRHECSQLRSLAMKYNGAIFLRCEVWIAEPDGRIHCYDVLMSEIREVAAYGR